MLSRRRIWGLTAIVATAVASLCWTSFDASAKASYACPYTLTQTYSAALRLLRVDNGYNVTERDPDAAYILFDYQSRESGNRTTSGAIEMIPSGDNVTVLVKLPQMPSYHETVLLDSLKRKLESEYGEPPRRPQPKPKDPPDAGADASPDGRTRRAP